MEKFLKAGAAALLAFSMVACSSSTPAEDTQKEDDKKEETAAEKGTGVYDVTNLTGEVVKELYVYTDAADKGENYAGSGMDKNAAVKITKADFPTDTKFVLEFTTEGGYTGSFTTLSVEEAPIYLLSKDLMTGATMISFKEPEANAAYTVTNVTGETVKELYLYDTGSSDKGENYAGEGMANDAVVELTKTLPATKTGDAVYTLEFVTESGYVGTFDTLHFEVAPIYLLSKDMMTGATMISFKKPE